MSDCAFPLLGAAEAPQGKHAAGDDGQHQRSNEQGDVEVEVEEATEKRGRNFEQCLYDFGLEVINVRRSIETTLVDDFFYWRKEGGKKGAGKKGAGKKGAGAKGDGKGSLVD